MVSASSVVCCTLLHILTIAHCCALSILSVLSILNILSVESPSVIFCRLSSAASRQHCSAMQCHTDRQISGGGRLEVTMPKYMIRPDADVRILSILSVEPASFVIFTMWHLHIVAHFDKVYDPPRCRGEDPTVHPFLPSFPFPFSYSSLSFLPSLLFLTSHHYTSSNSSGLCTLHIAPTHQIKG